MKVAVTAPNTINRFIDVTWALFGYRTGRVVAF
jgi:hypothetical protein